MSIWNGFPRVFPVTPSDTVNISTDSVEALFVAAAGNAVIIPAAGSTVTCTGLPAGTFIPIKTKRVNATGTTATLVALCGH